MANQATENVLKDLFQGDVIASATKGNDTHMEQSRYRPLPFQAVGTLYTGGVRIQHCRTPEALERAIKRMHQYCSKVETVVLQALLDKDGKCITHGNNYHTSQRQAKPHRGRMPAMYLRKLPNGKAQFEAMLKDHQVKKVKLVSGK